MKKLKLPMTILLTLVGIIIILAAVVLIRTWTYPFPERMVADGTLATAPADVIPSETAVRRFAGGLRIPTVSNQVYEDTDFTPFIRFRRYLEESYPAIYREMDTEVINEYGLVYHWKGRDESLLPILFLSHYDVVPATGDAGYGADEDEFIFNLYDDPAEPIADISEQWEHGPFSGAVSNGRIYGRGSVDMKCMLFSVMEAADRLIAEGFVPQQDVWFAFGHDEEVGGLHGAVEIAEYFRQKGLRFDAVYDEGGIIDGTGVGRVPYPIALVGTGEKGLLTLKITVRGLGGHSSMPPARTSLAMAAEIMSRLSSDQMPTRIIPPVADFLESMAAGQGFATRMALANRWLFGPVVRNMMTKEPSSNALARTTTAITMAKGSDAANVLPAASEITVNFRLLAGDTVEDVVGHVRKACEGYDTDIEIINAREASAVSPTDTRGFRAIQTVVAELYPEAVVTPYVTIGGTDAYKYQGVSDNIYRFLPILLNGAEQRLLHNDNEYLSLENYGRMIQFYRRIMVGFQGF